MMGGLADLSKAMGGASRLADLNKAIGAASPLTDLNKSINAAGGLADLSKSIGMAGGLADLGESIRMTSGLATLTRSMGTAGSLGALGESVRMTSGLEDLGSLIREIGGGNAAEVARFTARLANLGESIRAASGLAEFGRSIRSVGGLEHLSTAMAVELSGAIVDTPNVKPSLAVIERELGEDTASSPSDLSNKEWVYVVAIAETIRQIALEQPGVTDSHAAIVMVLAIWILATVWARAGHS